MTGEIDICIYMFRRLDINVFGVHALTKNVNRNRCLVKYLLYRKEKILDR